MLNTSGFPRDRHHLQVPRRSSRDRILTKSAIPRVEAVPEVPEETQLSAYPATPVLYVAAAEAAAAGMTTVEVTTALITT